MSNYVDKYGRYHDRKTPENGEPSSGNGYIYTAFAVMLGLPFDYQKVFDCARACYTELHESGRSFSMNRSPGISTPPMSRDEIIGLAGLKLLDYDALERSGFVFHQEHDFKVEKNLSLKGFIKAIKALYKIKDAHRNEVWMGKHYDGYTLAFRLSLADRYFVKKCFGVEPTLMEKIAFHSSAIFTALKPGDKTGDISAKNIIYYQLMATENYGHIALKFLDVKKQFERYFEEGHIFREKL